MTADFALDGAWKELVALLQELDETVLDLCRKAQERESAEAAFGLLRMVMEVRTAADVACPSSVSGLQPLVVKKLVRT